VGENPSAIDRQPRDEEFEMSPGSTSATVSSLMSGTPVVVHDDEAIPAVADLLAGFEITGLPVVDRRDRLVGVISQTDLVRFRGSTVPWSGWHGILVRDLMSTPARTVTPEAPVDEAARLMTRARVHRLVVVDSRETPIGVISESDIIREIADCCDDG
jgi:CBS domain-containing protein